MGKVIALYILLFSFTLGLWSCDGGKEVKNDADVYPEMGNETFSPLVDDTDNTEEETTDKTIRIKGAPVFQAIPKDAYSQVYSSARAIFSKNNHLRYIYQRVGCSDDTCKQEYVTFAAIQYPQDSLLQEWMANVLSRYYYDVTRTLDIAVNGEQMEDNGEGEMALRNEGCAPYEGSLDDGGKAMFDYFQARVWTIGMKRPSDVHGPAGRTGCTIYCCYQTDEVISYFVGYSTAAPQWPALYVVSFDRREGRLLGLFDVIGEDYVEDFEDKLLTAVRIRHRKLVKQHSKGVEEITIDDADTDYAVPDVTNYVIGFTAEGLAVSTGALSFDQWPTALHILIIPYAEINDILLPRFQSHSK